MAQKYRRPAELRRAVEAYFSGISCERCVTGDKGEPLLNHRGEEITELYYAVPPTVSGMCRALGISTRTWQNYADPDKHPEFAEIAAFVHTALMDYLEGESLRRKTAVQGVLYQMEKEDGREVPAPPKECAGIREKLEMIARAAKELEQIAIGDQ